MQADLEDNALGTLHGCADLPEVLTQASQKGWGSSPSIQEHSTGENHTQDISLSQY